MKRAIVNWTGKEGEFNISLDIHPTPHRGTKDLRNTTSIKRKWEGK